MFAYKELERVDGGRNLVLFSFRGGFAATKVGVITLENLNMLK